jgi:zinc/manganese transport system substrate-binding protein
MVFKFVFLSLFAATLSAKPLVLTTLPELAWLVDQLLPAEVESQSLLSGREDPHYLNVVPSHVRMVANADLLMSVGLDLEVGYLSALIKNAANLKLSKDPSRHLLVGEKIKTSGKITNPIDRSMGDVHPHGNPHFWLSAVKMKEAVEVVQSFLIQHYAAHGELIAKNALTLTQKLEALHLEASKQCENVGSTFAEYHNEFHYFFDDYELETIGHLEDKPGLPPSLARIRQFAELAQSSKVNLLLASKTHPASVLQKFSQLSGIEHKQVATIMPRKADYLGHFRTQLIVPICAK